MNFAVLHVHFYPECYEDEQCTMDCTLDEDDDGILRGGTTHCAGCRPMLDEEKAAYAGLSLMAWKRLISEDCTVAAVT